MQKRSLLARLLNTLRPQRQTFSASPVNERNVSQGVDWTALYRDRYSYDRAEIQAQALLAWRLNPLARRIVEIGTQYVTDGIDFKSDDPTTQQFLQDFWNHPLNKIGEHLREWSDELALTGNLFPCITTDRAGMSYLRIFPTDLIDEIEVKPNDVQQETAYKPKATPGETDPVAIVNYWASELPASIAHSGDTSRQSRAYRGKKPKTVMLHYAVNRLAGMLWGEPDIAPLLPWLARYAAWLEDRVRLNRFRQSFMYVVRGKFANQAEKDARQKALANNPPAPGSILVTDESEDWGILNPQLDSFEAGEDGLALKKFIAGGRGYPLHWLAEPESSTRTTAEAAGTPTFKGLQARQQMFLSMLKDILTIVATRAGHSGPIVVSAADISERDNAALALASSQVVNSFGQLWANGFIDDAEYLRVVYRFAGEQAPAARPDAPHNKTKTTPQANNDNGTAGQVKVDTETGDVKIKEPKG